MLKSASINTTLLFFTIVSTSTLGLYIIKKFLENNYYVLLGYHKNIKELNRIKEELSKYKDKIKYEYIDIINEENVKNIFNKYNIDILINNASLSIDNYIPDKSYEEFIKVINVNLGGTYLMCKYANNAKYIINISSKDGIDTYNPISLDYSSSKSGIINLTKNLSLYYKDKYLYVVCPGWINTSSVNEMNPLYLKEELKRCKQNKLISPEYVANKIYSLIDSNLESGSVVIIDEEK